MSVPTRRTAANERSGQFIYDMELPFNPNNLKHNAQAHGLDRLGAAVFAHLALQEVRELHEKNPENPVTALQIAEAIKRKAAEEVLREEQEEAEREWASQQEIEQSGISWDDMDLDLDGDSVEMLRQMEEVTISEDETNGVRRKKFKFSEDGLEEYFSNSDPYSLSDDMAHFSLKYNGHDLISGICQNVELAVELGKYLSAVDIFNLYRANRAFYNAVNCYLLSSVRTWIAHNAPDAGRVFSYKLYRKHLIFDPAGRTWQDQVHGMVKPVEPAEDTKVRSVPGLKYLQLVMGRDRYCREIVAIMARSGHRMPPTMPNTLLRLWLLMDVSTSTQRAALLRSRQLWSDYDIYNAQFFFIKLGMHFNDPIYGPCSWDMVHLMMGQKGLYPLWQVLTRKKITTLSEVIELRVRYNFELPPDHWGNNYFDKTVHGVPFNEIGIGHLEGWGRGDRHLQRPDELIPVEAIARGLQLDEHLTNMMVWGYFDWKTGENIVPSEEEMYISDEEKVLGQMDTHQHWKHKHVLKKHFRDLTPEQQQEIIDDDEDERLRAMAWCGDNIDDYSSEDEDRPYSLEDEINRSFIIPTQPKDHKSTVPAVDDQEGWVDFVNQAIMGIVPEIDEEEKLKAEAWESYHAAETDGKLDWGAWLRQELHGKGTGGDDTAASDASGDTDETEIAVTEDAEESQDAEYNQADEEYEGEDEVDQEEEEEEEEEDDNEGEQADDEEADGEEIDVDDDETIVMSPEDETMEPEQFEVEDEDDDDEMDIYSFIHSGVISET